ncbi:hypothetical protein M5362_04470 [Streptomyces sp. Je 1-79]|uniref:hypothetical protein n=1 Tax=Streptomyces sp. Je 1-79 TaxID=2943847 RepID=UPI0021A8BDB5|nr:hypothetical protein [Streptomyces sp. Je 1-79]MCT4352387.1 hypothetical protein [Streptomyces sp. Je 1-79]
MTLPRAVCPVCARTVALKPTRRAGHGSVTDHKRERKSLSLCPGSETHLPYTEANAWQLEIPALRSGPAEDGDSLRLF